MKIPLYFLLGCSFLYYPAVRGTDVWFVPIICGAVALVMILVQEVFERWDRQEYEKRK